MASIELKLIVDAETGIAKIKSFGEAVEGSAAKQKTAWDAVGGALKSLVTLYVVDKGIDFLKSSVEEFGNAEKAAAKLEAVLKATHGAAGLSAQGMKDYAAQLQDTTAFEDDAIVNAEAMLATFTNINNPDLFKEAMGSALDLSTVMDGDLKGAVLQVGKALNDPSEGLKALRMSGISFTSSQIEMIKKLQESGDLLGAQKIILAEVKTEMGGAAEAAGKTFAGQMERLTNEMGNAKEALGGLIANGISPLIPKATEAAQGLALFFGNLGKGQEMSQTDKLGKQFAFITERIFEANKEVERLKGLYGASAESVGAYHDAVKKVEMLEKQRAGILGQNAALIKKNADAEKASADAKAALLQADKEVDTLQKNKKAREEYAAIAKKTMAEIGTEEDKLWQKHQLAADKIKGSSQEAYAARYALALKLSEDVGAIRGKDAEKAAKVLKDYAALATQTLGEIGTIEEKLVQKHQLEAGKITGDSQEAADARYALELKLSQDLVGVWDAQAGKYSKMTSAQLLEIKQASQTTIEEKQKVTAELQLRDDNSLTHFKDNFAVSLGATKTFYEQMGELGAAFGTATKKTMADAINDGIMGTPKTPEEYGKALGGALSSAFSTLAAETIMKEMAVMYAEITAMSGAAGSASGEVFSYGWSVGWIGAFVIYGAVLTKYLDDAFGKPWLEKATGGFAGFMGAVGQLSGIQFLKEWDLSTKDWSVNFKESLTALPGLIGDAFSINAVNSFIDSCSHAVDEIKKFGAAITTLPNIADNLNTDPFTGTKMALDGIREDVQWLIDNVGKIPGLPGLPGGGGATGGGGLGISGSIPGVGGFSFADGGIMTSHGALPLHMYSSGGIANTPQIAVYGEGRMPEAYIPLPDHRTVPVTLTGPPSAPLPPVQIVVQVGTREIFNDFIDLLNARHFTIPAHSVR